MPKPKEKKSRVLSNLDFKIMSMSYKMRDFYRPRSRIIEDVGIKTGARVLDYGCGPGGYVMPVIKLIGDTGMFYALDIHPVAVKSVKDLISKKGLSNVQAILSDCDTGLSDSTIDVVLLYDILHDLENRDKVLAELHRVLIPGGILSVSDHHLKEEEIVSGITGGGLFEFSAKGKSTYNFFKK
jgi:ubiquinone/menaquinone biosynthesis C-methylase UbiE